MSAWLLFKYVLAVGLAWTLGPVLIIGVIALLFLVAAYGAHWGGK